MEKSMSLQFDADGNVIAPPNVQVKRCRPGRAYGADDLSGWARRRNIGKSGVENEKKHERALNARTKRRSRTPQGRADRLARERWEAERAYAESRWLGERMARDRD